MKDYIAIKRYQMQTELVINDGRTLVYVIRSFIDSKSANDLCTSLKDNIPWEHYDIMMYGKLITQPRRTYACGDDIIGSHRYSGQDTPVGSWSSTSNAAALDQCHSQIKYIKDKITETTGIPLNSCLLNEYIDGSNYIGYHSDKEVNKYNNSVFIVSTGGSRDFHLRNKATGETIKVVLRSGDLCSMQGRCQEEWTHSIPKRAKDKAKYRISLSYRWLDR